MWEDKEDGEIKDDTQLFFLPEQLFDSGPIHCTMED